VVGGQCRCLDVLTCLPRTEHSRWRVVNVGKSFATHDHALPFPFTRVGLATALVLRYGATPFVVHPLISSPCRYGASKVLCPSPIPHPVSLGPPLHSEIHERSHLTPSTTLATTSHHLT
jgi:hypothetical protein